jgi:hypothetical protein
MQTEQDIGILVVQTEFHDTLDALAPIFNVPPAQIERWGKPAIAFIAEEDHLFDEYHHDINVLCMARGKITKYILGFNAGTWFYQNINPEIRKKTSELADLIDERTSDKECLQAFELLNAHQKLEIAISHYSGILHGGRTAIAATMSKMRDLPEDMSMAVKATLKTVADGMAIAETIYERFSTEQFSELVRLGFEEARERVKYMAEMDLMV